MTPPVASVVFQTSAPYTRQPCTCLLRVCVSFSNAADLTLLLLDIYNAGSSLLGVGLNIDASIMDRDAPALPHLVTLAELKLQLRGGDHSTAVGDAVVRGLMLGSGRATTVGP